MMTTAAMSTNGLPSCNLFIAGLLHDVDDRRLEEAFASYGRILSSKVMVDLHTAKSRGFGFVLFQKVEDAIRAQQGMHDASTDMGHLVVQFSTAHSTTHLKEKSDSIYIRNIPKGTQRKQVIVFAAQFGTVTKLDLLPDTAPGATGDTIVARVSFQSVQEAVAAEREIQCRANPFEKGGAPLLAKLAENAVDRARRILATRKCPMAQKVLSRAAANDSPVQRNSPVPHDGPLIASTPFVMNPMPMQPIQLLPVPPMMLVNAGSFVYALPSTCVGFEIPQIPSPVWRS